MVILILTHMFLVLVGDMIIGLLYNVIITLLMLR